MEISIVIPLYNEEGNVAPLLHSVYSNLSGIIYELILVDDGSTDSTVQLILENKNLQTRLIVFDKNYGQSAAIHAGIEYSQHNVIAIMDGDLQNDPKDIHLLINELKCNGCALIQGYRKKRHDSISKVIPSAIANRLVRFLFGLGIHDIGCSLKVFRREILSSFIFFNGFHRYIPLLAHQRQFTIGEIEITHHPRHSGKSKYGINRIKSVIYHLWLFRKKQLSTLASVPYQIKEVW